MPREAYDYRRGKEFSELTKDIVWKRANGLDEITGEPLTDPRYHHIVPLAWARDNAQDIPAIILSSPENAQLINHTTHVETHRSLTDEDIIQHATYLRTLFASLL